MNGFGLRRERFAWLYAVMLIAAAGNTAMQSLLPAIGRALGIGDLWVAFAFSLSALVWVVTAPLWAQRADRRGRRALMRIGLYGFIGSSLICGAVLALGLSGWLDAVTVFLIFIAGRAVYGGFGSASPPAVQAYVAARTRGRQRTNALSTIASSFGVGTVIGPGIAPLFIFYPLGLSGPMIVFAGVGLLVLAGLVLRLPDDTPKADARGSIVAYPSMAAAESPPPASSKRPRLAWTDRRVLPWHLIGVVGGHGQAALLGVIGFLIIDRLEVPLDQAQHWIAIVLIGGAAASLLAQWWLIPQLALEPRALVVWGSLVASIGLGIAGLSTSIYGITMGFGLASLGFGLFRPGFTSGASLAVTPHEQNAVAGMVTSVAGVAFIAGPAIGVLLYQIALPAPFLTAAAMMAALAAWAQFSFRPSSPAE